MNISVNIRKCTADDLPALCLHEPPGAKIAEGFLVRQTAGELLYATAWTGGTPHGGAVLDFRAGPVPELKHLFVYPGSRGAGIGSALCRWLEEQARLAGHSAIVLGVEPGNTAGRKLYKGLGYRPTGATETCSYEFTDPDGNRSVATETAALHHKQLGPPWAIEPPAGRGPTPPAPSRVLFYGVTGSGKSTAARAYAQSRGLPGFSADDDTGWLPGWQQRTVEEQRGIAASLAAQDRWVLDSAYGAWRDVVLPRAELIVCLDYPRWLSLARLIRRTLRRALTREPVCNGNEETIARLFTQGSILRWHFRSFTRKRQVMRGLEADPRMPAIVMFRRPRELDAWLAQLTGTSDRAESP
ncbi:GNAT family N-acetyltransferase [Arthrobacter sp. AL08]|uniref:GNAT family N-acetyltransferase n=1 Tax=unclassified Arthrobacter TaxID=235627 RepID=UPI00249A7A76|nr:MULTISPECIES: GNAT family N-acetyltransferase [unclassified Arthrobacter]MDI3240728.1 GNAT family N-acetyltransferase [Arthrobacter sp. AL05]MDI3276738.1 GNAT family N-acetyltransferase [Arthrobacter sp. AL08]